MHLLTFCLESGWLSRGYNMASVFGSMKEPYKYISAKMQISTQMLTDCDYGNGKCVLENSQ